MAFLVEHNQSYSSWKHTDGQVEQVVVLQCIRGCMGSTWHSNSVIQIFFWIDMIKERSDYIYTKPQKVSMEWSTLKFSKLVDVPEIVKC